MDALSQLIEKAAIVIDEITMPAEALAEYGDGLSYAGAYGRSLVKQTYTELKADGVDWGEASRFAKRQAIIVCLRAFCRAAIEMDESGEPGDFETGS